MRAGLSAQVVRTIQASRADSTKSCYDAKWLGFQRWCIGRGEDPLACSLPEVLSFLQLLMDRGLAHATIKVYAAAISSCHEGWGGTHVFAHPLVKRFLQGVRRRRPVTRTSVPQWELPLVLEALCKGPYEPIERSSLKALSLKTAFLLALTSAKRISELCALSVNPSCLLIRGDRSGATLRPNPAFVPKNIRSSFRSRDIHLEAFHLPPHGDPSQAKLHLLCPVRALAYYVERTASVRSTQQLLVCYGDGVVGKALSKNRLARWLCECISAAYDRAGRTPPAGIRAHSTRAVAASAALFSGASVEDICTAASWASPWPFIRFYLLDVSGSFSGSVLSVGTQNK